MDRIDTLAVHAAREDLAALGVHVPPIDLSSTSPLPDVEAGGESYERLAGGAPPEEGASFVYQRLWNPTVARFEEAIARLEGAEEGAAFASGMAATTALLLSTVAAGTPHIVAIRPVYGGTDHLLSTGLLGTRVTWTDAESVGEAIEPDTGLVFLETPANPTLEMVDIAAVVSRIGSVPLAVDNTFATPVLQRPLSLGASLVLHSATKFIGGHSDILGGVVVGAGERIHRIRSIRAITGGLLHPIAAYQLHRGLQTLPVRVRAQQESARKVAERFTRHPAVERVHYPGVEGGDPQGLVGRQMSGPGSLLALRMKGGYEAAAAVASRTSTILHAVSLGGVDSLLSHPAALTHRPVAPDARPAASVIRVSVGLEDPDDLIADLERAMEGLDG